MTTIILSWFLDLINDTQLEVSSGSPVDCTYAHWCGIALILRMRVSERTKTRRAFAAAKLDQRQRQRGSSPWYPLARTTSLLLSPESIAPFWSSQTLFLRLVFLFQCASLRGMPRLSGISRDHSPAGTSPLPFRSGNAPPTKHKFLLSFALKRPCTPFASLVRYECTSSNGQTEQQAATPLSDSEATALDFSTYVLGIAFLAPIFNHAERMDCADCAADAARTGKGLGDAERGSAERGGLECRLIAAPASRREVFLCSARPCAAPF